MQIYIPFELENKLRVWAKENNRTIGSVVTEGIGIIIKYTTSSVAEKNEKPPIPRVVVEEGTNRIVEDKSGIFKQRGELSGEDYV